MSGNIYDIELVIILGCGGKSLDWFHTPCPFAMKFPDICRQFIENEKLTLNQHKKKNPVFQRPTGIHQANFIHF
jgi:hypothetical protein